MVEVCKRARWLAVLCVVSLKPARHPRRPTHSDLFSASIIPSPNIPAATPPREAPKLPRCTAQPAQLRLPTISWQLFVLCARESVPPYYLVCDGGPGRRPTPIKPSKSSPTRANSPGKTRHGRVPSLLGWIETRVTPCACPVLRCTVILHMCTICICRDARCIRQTGRVCDVSVVSPKFRCRPERLQELAAA